MVSGHLRWSAACLAALALFLPSRLAGQAMDLDGDEVVALRFEGNRNVRTEHLRAAIATEQTRCRNPLLLPVCLFGRALDRRYADPRLLEADALRIRLYYHQRGYRQTRVRTETAARRGGLRVTFHIEEGEPVRVVSVVVDGLPDPAPANLASNLALETGDALDLLRYEETRDSLVTRLRNAGYARGEVLASYFIPAAEPYGAEVRFELVPGSRARFGEVAVEGTARVAPAVVRRLLTFQPGDLYRHGELLRSQRNLFGLDVFRHAEIRPSLDAEPDTLVPVTVFVRESPVRRVRVGAGLSTAECANAEGRWTSRNFLGGARRLELRGRITNVLADQFAGFPCLHTGTGTYSRLSGLVSADFTQPWFFGPDNTLGAGVFGERRSLPDVFVRTGVGGHITVRRRLSEHTSVGISFRPELTRLDAKSDVFFCVSFVACAEPEIRLLQEPHRLAPVALVLNRDRSDAIFAPTRGHLFQMELEHAASATGSEFAYTRLSGELRSYRALGSGRVLAGRVRPGMAWANGEPGLELHPQRRFFAGGANSVRGFAQYRLGPKVLTVDAAQVLADSVSRGGAGCSAQEINTGACDASPVSDRRFEVRPVGGAAMLEAGLELRFPLGSGRFGGAAFLDVGQVWDDREVSVRDLAWSPGFGIRYFSPVGPIRLDLGYHPGRAEELAVVTTRVCAPQPDGPCLEDGPYNGEVRNMTTLQPLQQSVLFDPRRSLLDRVQLHISIGQAF